MFFWSLPFRIHWTHLSNSGIFSNVPFKMSRNSQLHLIDITFPLFERVSYLMSDLISGGDKKRPRPLDTRQWSCHDLPIFPPAVPPPSLPTGILYSPQFRSHQETKVVARRTSTTSRKNNSANSPADPRMSSKHIEIYNLGQHLFALLSSTNRTGRCLY